MTASIPVEEQRQARAVRELIKAAGGLEEAHGITGKSTSQLGRCSSPNDKDSLSIRDVELLESVTHDTTGHPHVSRHLAANAGFVLFRKPTVRATGADLLGLVARQAQESGDITAKMIAALADKKLNQAEIADLRREVRELIEVAVCMDAELSALETDRE